MPPTQPDQQPTSNPITPINPPKTLLSLPKELLTEVCSYLDQKNAISLLYVHRALHQPAESRIYREINLFIPTYWGEPVLIRPANLRYGTDPYCTWAKKQALDVENAGRAEARRRAEEMIKVLSRGDGRWRYVRKVVIEPRPGAVNAIIQILSLAREYITEIQVVQSRKHIYRSQWEPPVSQTIWAKLLELQSYGNFIMPNLLTIRVRLEEYDCSALPLTLFVLAGRLDVLEIDGGRTNHAGVCSDEDECPCADVDLSRCPETSRKLSIVRVEAKVSQDNPSNALLEWLGSYTRVESLALRIRATGYLRAKLEYCDWLHEMLHAGTSSRLDFRLGRTTFAEVLDVGDDADIYHEGWPLDSKLNSLIQDAPGVRKSAKERLEYVPLDSHIYLASVTALGFRTPYNAKADRIKSLLSHGRAQQTVMFRDNVQKTVGIAEDLIHKLLYLKHLETVQFFDHDDALAEFIPPSQWEATATHGVIIRSLHHEDSVLLHIRTYSQSGTPESASDDAGGSAEIKHVKLPESQWEDVTDFQGHVVPLWVMSRMKQVQGTKEPWVGRGIEVNKKAWQVLLDWQKAVYPDNEEEGVKKEVTSDSAIDVAEMEDSVGPDVDESDEDEDGDGDDSDDE